MKKILKIGTRGSSLAMKQTSLVADMIHKQFPDLKIEINTIKTKGDIMQDVSLVKIGGKGVFVKEIEDALLSGDIDVAIHSMKDMPAELPAGLEIAVTPLREDPRDVLISRNNLKLEAMPRGARIGTGSLRREVQICRLLPDIEIVPIRGNIDTRINKIEKENLDGVIVAAAGIRRMGWVQRVSQFIPVEILLPAVGQGILGIELRQEDSDTRDAVAFLNNNDTWLEATAERAFLRRLGGGCQLPIAAYAKKERDHLAMWALLGSMDGQTMIRKEQRGRIEQAEAIGISLAEDILAEGGCALMEEFYKTCS